MRVLETCTKEHKSTDKLVRVEQSVPKREFPMQIGKNKKSTLCLITMDAFLGEYRCKSYQKYKVTALYWRLLRKWINAPTSWKKHQLIDRYDTWIHRSNPSAQQLAISTRQRLYTTHRLAEACSRDIW